MGKKLEDQTNKNEKKLKKFCMDSGVMRVARGGSGAKAPALAARPIGQVQVVFGLLCDYKCSSDRLYDIKCYFGI